ncbi:MAG: hypothetical protein AB8F78_00495 [Saprospiraceae bacterium]
MKNFTLYILLGVFTLLSSALCAQIASTKTPLVKGKPKYTGGIFALKSELIDESSQVGAPHESLAANIKAYFGIEISQRFDIGPFIRYGYQDFIPNSTRSPQNQRRQISQTLGGGFFTRYYLNDGTFRLFFESQLSYNLLVKYGRGPTIDEIPTYKSVLAVAISPSIAYTVKRVRLVANLGSLSYLNYSSRAYDNGRGGKTIVEKGFSTFLFNMRPRYIGIGGEYLF